MTFVESLQTPINEATDTRTHTEFSDVDEAVAYIERGKTTLEYLTPGTITKLYFDKDCYTLAHDDEAACELMREEGLTLIRKYLLQTEEKLPDEAIAIAKRHRWTEGKGKDKGKQVWKTSFRYYVPAFSMEFQYIKTLLESHDDDFFDLSVYGSKKQLYSCVFNCKDRNTKGDNVTLEPITGHPTEDFLVQHVG